MSSPAKSAINAFYSLLVAGAVLLAPLSAQAAAIVTDSNTSLGPTGFDSDYGLTVYQDLAGDYTQVFIDFDGVSIEVVNWVIDEESDWYLVAAGDVFSTRTIGG
jgi:hypothetical protein